MRWGLIAEAADRVAKGRVRDIPMRLAAALGLDRLGRKSPAEQRLTFTLAFVALAAKMAAADGVVVDVEREAFHRCYCVDPAERANVARVFDLAKRDTAGFELYAGQIGRLLKDDPVLLDDVFECLFHVAAADGIIHRAEEDFLRRVALRFGFSEEKYKTVRRMFVYEPGNPYEVLGIEPGASDPAVKDRHRALVRQHHPDRLAAHGVPEDFRATADRKLAVINAAYDAIRKERGKAARA